MKSSVTTLSKNVLIEQQYIGHNNQERTEDCQDVTRQSVQDSTARTGIPEKRQSGKDTQKTTTRTELSR
jgi:hypothetical protein